MGKKRKSRGRSKGNKGHGSLIQCSGCGGMVPRDKAKKVYRWTSLMDSRLAQELRHQGAFIPRAQTVKYYCVSCAVHRGLYSPRQQEVRRRPYDKRKGR